MTRAALLAACLVSCLALTACPSSSTSGPVALASAPILTERNDNAQITLARGATLTLRMTTQAGTGYAWVISRTDPNLLDVSPPTTEPGDPRAQGGEEVQVFRLTAKAPGSTTLELLYARGPRDASAKPYHVTVTVP